MFTQKAGITGKGGVLREISLLRIYLYRGI